MVLIVALAALFTIFNIVTDGEFFISTNMSVVLAHAVVPAFIAWGISFLFTTGFMDLSMGAIVILACNVGGELAMVFGYPGLILGAVLIGILALLLNVNVAHYLKIPPWISCIGMAMLYEAIMCTYSASKVEEGMTVINLGVFFRELGTMPLLFIICIVGLVAAYLLFSLTTIGVNIRAIGSNAPVAKMMGVNTRKTVLLSAVIAGIFLGMASAINQSYAGMQTVSSGLGSIFILFKPMAIFFLAQAFEKYTPLPVGIFISAIFIAGLFNFLTWIGVPSGTGQNIVMGLSIVFCGILAQWGNKEVVK